LVEDRIMAPAVQGTPQFSQAALAAAPHGATISSAATTATTASSSLLSAAQLALAGFQVGGALRRGRESEEIHEQRAAIDRANAIAAEAAAVEKAKILAERGERLKARQKAGFISGGIRSNVGVPLLVEAQTKADIAKDVGFSLDVGRAEAGQFRASADIERRIGKFKRRRSRFDAIGVGKGAGISFLGLQ
jgi:hypothetical protein